jgi:hypothetical protein
MLKYSWNVYLDCELTGNSIRDREASSYSAKLKDRKIAWLASQRLYTHINRRTAEDFWSWFQNHALPTSLPADIRGIRFFRHQKSIAQEDYPYGGKVSFSMNYSLSDEVFIHQLNQLWLDLLLKLIINEEGWMPADALGVVVKVKSKSDEKAVFKLEIWLESISSTVDVDSFISHIEDWIVSYELLASAKSAVSYRSFVDVATSI